MERFKKRSGKKQLKNILENGIEDLDGLYEKHYITW